MDSFELPDGVFSEVFGAGDVGQELSKSDIDLICFTGSTQVGKSLYKTAADKFIKAILEMGGSSPCILFEDFDIDLAIPKIYSGRYSNCGQVCDAIKRLIVNKSIFAETSKKLAEEIKKHKLGNPEEFDTEIGSLVAKRQIDLLQGQVKDALEKGARVICGGKPSKDLKGAFYEPTILTNISRDMRVWQEEIFGPVLPIISFSTEEEAIDLANDTIYGLGSRVFSKDEKRAMRVASKIQAGTVEINLASRWIKENPFGGYKLSGMGRQNGYAGLRELCQIKVISRNK
jgi:aldehyde dehydrogenase (NAD+)